MLNAEPSIIFANLFTLVIAFTLHEFAHAWTADYFGDDTPRLQGRLTLNPLAHLDPIGSLLLIFAGFGWARPVMVDPYRLRRRSPHAMMLVALAGPVSNLLMAIVAAIPFRLGWLQVENANSGMIPTINFLWSQFIFLNLLLMLFNLLPIAPLDGDKIFAHFLPPTVADWFETIRPYGPVVLMLLMFAGGGFVFNYILYPPLGFLFRLLVGL
ncbi:MAG: site-2 protease family protein [Anaerolineales bacterium]